MAYSIEQLTRTMNYIFTFFKPETDSLQNQFKGILQYFFINGRFTNANIAEQPDVFEFKKNTPEIKDIVDWINQNIKSFPDDFNIILTRSGSSICQFSNTTEIIYETTSVKNNEPTYFDPLRSFDDDYSNYSLRRSEPMPRNNSHTPLGGKSGSDSNSNIEIISTPSDPECPNSVNHSPDYPLNVRDTMQVVGSSSDSGSNSDPCKRRRPQAILPPVKLPANSPPITIITIPKKINTHSTNTLEGFLELKANPFYIPTFKQKKTKNTTITADDQGYFGEIFEMELDEPLFSKKTYTY